MASKGILAIAILLCSGCAFQSQVDRATVDYNQAVANSTNDLTLLNIVRAMKRHPLHFTTMSKISGSFRVTGRAGLNTDIVEPGGSDKLSAVGALIERTATIGAEKFVPSAGAEVTAGPSFDIGILDTQEFYQGILRSVDPDLVGSFINMGWPDDMVTAMFVERIELHVPAGHGGGAWAEALGPDATDGGELVWVLENDPDDDDESREFGQFLKCFRLRPASRTAAATRLWPVADMDKLKMGDLAMLDGEKLSLSTEEPGRPRYVERPQPTVKTLGLKEVPLAGAERECSFEFVSHDGARKQRVSIDIFHRREKRREIEALIESEEHEDSPGIAVELTRPGAQNVDAERDDVPASIHIVLRSAQAIIYYLGEYARASLLQKMSPYRLPIDGQPVIDVRPGRVRGAFATATLAGETYSIEDDFNGRSLSAISLVQQVINLQKSARDKPTTTSVRVVD